MAVFWRKGYEGTSLDDLTRAMRINRPSLYAAFGNKEALFRTVLKRYESRAGYACNALAASTAREVAERLLYGAAENSTKPGHPRLPNGPRRPDVRRRIRIDPPRSLRETRRRRSRAARSLRARQRAGDLPRTCNAADLARFVVTVVRGISLQAAAGASRRQLHAVAETALCAWPGGRAAPSSRSMKVDD